MADIGRVVRCIAFRAGASPSATAALEASSWQTAISVSIEEVGLALRLTRLRVGALAPASGAPRACCAHGLDGA
jgi:hypothetical protein